MNTILRRPQAEFIHDQIMALDAIIKTGEYDAMDALRKTKSILQVIKCTLEKDGVNDCMFGTFDK